MLELSFGIVFALGLVALSNDRRQGTTERIREALRLSNISLTDAAEVMRLHKSDLCNALAGLQKLDLWRLEMLPDEFHSHYYLLGLRDRGLPEYAKTALKVQPALKEDVA